MKGIILAGGSLDQITSNHQRSFKTTSPIYDKPMIYYPLSTLMRAGINKILIISTPQDISGYKRLLSDGSEIGLEIEYAEQPSPDGLAQVIIGKDFIKNDSVCLVLGDNIFYGYKFEQLLTNAKNTVENSKSACVFGYYVNDPERYGVAEFDD